MDSPHYYWKAEIDFKTMRSRLGEPYGSLGALKNIKVTERTGTGRVRALELTDDKGRNVKVPAKDFRLFMGANVIRSTNFTIVLSGSGKVVFNGKGWGHGVGLCQWGARGMSLQDYSYDKILEFYYPGTVIAEI
jgi:stage II sporulation protein D